MPRPLEKPFDELWKEIALVTFPRTTQSILFVDVESEAEFLLNYVIDSAGNDVVLAHHTCYHGVRGHRRLDFLQAPLTPSGGREDSDGNVASLLVFLPPSGTAVTTSSVLHVLCSVQVSFSSFCVLQPSRRELAELCRPSSVLAGRLSEGFEALSALWVCAFPLSGESFETKVSFGSKR